MSFKKPLKPQLISRTLIHKDYLALYEDKLRHPDGREFSYYNVELPPQAVMVLAKTSEGSWILNTEYRHPTSDIILGCPGGIVDPQESPIDAAKRELLEETGYIASNYSFLGEVFPFPGITGQKVLFYKAENATLNNEPSPEVAEFITPLLLNDKGIDSWIESGKKIDGILCTAFFLYKRCK